MEGRKLFPLQDRMQAFFEQLPVVQKS